MIITKIVDDTNNVDTQALERNIAKAIDKGFKTLPDAS